MARRTLVAAPGVYKNGRLYWVRTVKSPLAGRVASLSTGTDSLERANAVRDMVVAMAQNPTQFAWLDAALARAVTLDQLYTHHVAGTLTSLEQQLTARRAAERDPDLDAVVDRWLSESVARRSLADDTKADYARHIRALIPAGKRFAASAFTSDTLSARLDKLPVGDLTRRHYVAGWRLFYQWARVRVPTLPNPFDDTTWTPAPVSPRSVTWDFETTTRVLDRMHSAERVAMSLIFGSGMELSALLGMRREHVSAIHDNIIDDERTVVAPGSKNEHREERTVFVDRWAWVELRDYVKPFLPRAPLFPFGDGKCLREAFYAAQVAADLIAKPETSASGKKLWAAVKPHRLHDARHTYCEIRGLGLDGEEPQDITFLSHQLGHADEQMVMRIYKKKNIKERLRLLRLQRAQQAARAAATQ